MPNSLPDPVLALSMDNVLKLNDLNLDQLANLWNVFTKCKESLESGRRLENLSWRLWFREAHILPPDTSLSDLTDFTPIDTPLISRANSISGSYKHARIPSALTPQLGNALSDPEDGNETEDSTDSEEAGPSSSKRLTAPTTTPVKRRVRASVKPAPAHHNASASERVAGPSSSAFSPRSGTTQRLADQIADRMSRATPPSSRRATLLESEAESNRRKRMISSSSAFGSKARVKQRNQGGVPRRRPLSFQTALENLVLTGRADTFASLRGKQSSMSRLDARMAGSTGALDAPRGRGSEDHDDQEIEHSSAPAELSPLKASTISQAMLASQVQKAFEPHAADATASGSHLQSARKSTDRCDAPETSGPLSPSKMTIALAPTVGGISRRGSETMLVNAADKNKAHEETTTSGTQSDSVQKKDSNALQSMPPPAGVPEPTPAASAFKQKTVASIPPSASAAQSEPQEQKKVEQPAQQAQTSPFIGMTRTESASSTATESSVKSSNGARRPSEAKVKARASVGGLHVGHRSKSSTGLQRAAKHSKSSDRVASANRSAPRHNLLSGLAMTRAAPEAAQAPSTVTRKPVPPVTAPVVPKTKAQSSATAAAAAAAAAAAKKAPVKFTMGGDETDSEDYEDESDDDNSNNAIQPAKEASNKVEPKATAGNGADDDEWADDSEEEELERKARQAAEAERRKREEEERHKAMFQKQPIRSKSAADVRLLPPHQISRGPSPPAQPVRGLLSSLFHPDEQHSPPGQLAGRPHASAADLRAKPMMTKKVTSGAAHSPPTTRRARPHRDSNESGVAPFSFRDGGFAGIGGLKTSKSAVALPLLDTHITKSSTAGKARQVSIAADRASAGSHHSEGSGGSSPDSPVATTNPGGRPSSIAIARLHALTNMKSHAQRNSTNAGSDQQQQASGRKLSATEAEIEREASSRSLRLEVSPDDRDFAIPSRASTSNLAQNQRKLSAPTLASRYSDQVPQCQREELGSGSRSNSEGPPPGHASSAHGSQTNGPVSISRPRSSLNLPESAAPQSPRTTRRNMLRDELSESLRQNLLWERQSRSRMMGIGAPVSPLQPQQAQQHPPASNYRRDNVLNGGMLRPLTSTGAPPSQSRQNDGKPKRYSEEWGSFHHKGW